MKTFYQSAPVNYFGLGLLSVSLSILCEYYSIL